MRVRTLLYTHIYVRIGNSPLTINVFEILCHDKPANNIQLNIIKNVVVVVVGFFFYFVNFLWLSLLLVDMELMQFRTIRHGTKIYFVFHEPLSGYTVEREISICHISLQAATNSSTAEVDFTETFLRSGSIGCSRKKVPQSLKKVG